MIDGPQDWTRPRRAWCFAGIVVAALGLGTAAKAIAAVRIVDNGLHLASPYFDIRLSLGQPGFAALVFDGLGEAKPGPNALRPPPGNDVYRATHGVQDGRAWVEYRREGTPAEAPPGWRFEIGDRRSPSHFAVVAGGKAPRRCFSTSIRSGATSRCWA